MRSSLSFGLELCRFNPPGIPSTTTGDLYGIFQVSSPQGARLRIISSGAARTGSSEEETWEHVSITVVDRCPTWDEMCFVKDLFWDESETIVQFHPKRSEYVNKHPFCLHLWKPPGGDVLLPPSNCVG